jgi:hypothetical protein
MPKLVSTIMIMPNDRSHVHNFYEVDLMCSGVVPWLNAEIPRASRIRVETLIRLLQKVETSSNMNEKSRLIREANRILRRCKVFRFVTDLHLNGVEHLADWIPTNKPRGVFEIESPNGTKNKVSEDDALLSVSELYVMLSIDQLRKCDYCQKWLCARFSHQRFCSARCREKRFQSSPEWKEQRRRKAREYYRLHRTKNVK